MSLPLAALALRRACSRGVALWAAVLAALALAFLRRDSPLLTGDIDACAITRSSVWTLFAAVLAPWPIVHAAATVGRWRAREIEWLAGVPTNRTTLFASTWLGFLVAGAAVVVLAMSTAELCVPHSHTTSACVATFEPPRGEVIGGPSAVEHSVAVGAVEPGAQLRAQLVFVPTSVHAEVEWLLERAGKHTTTRALVARSSTLAAVIPAGDGTLTSTWTRAEGGALLYFDDAPLELHVQGRSARAASLVLAARAMLAWAALVALALGLGAWMRPAIAFGCAACVVLGTSGFDIHWLNRAAPWSALCDALAFSARDVVPPWPGATDALAAAAWSAFGWLAFASGTRRWRTPA